MGLADLPAEILTDILGFLIPNRWNEQCCCYCFKKPCTCRSRCLNLRLISKQFDCIVSYIALRNVSTNFDWAFIHNSHTVKWLLATKLRYSRDIDAGLSAAVWSSVASIARWKMYQLGVFEEKEYLEAACGMLVASQGHQWAWDQLTTISDDRARHIPSKAASSKGKECQEISTQEHAIQAMVCYCSLHIAAYYGDALIVQTLLQNKSNPNLSNDYFGSALYAASYNGHLNIVRLLIENGAAFDGQGYLGAPLEAATHRGHIKVLQLLLERGSKFYPGSVIQKCLHDASVQGNPQVVQVLLENTSVNINAKTATGHETPLILAAINNNFDVAELLLSHHNIKVNLVDWAGRTALHRACSNGSVDVARLLLGRKDVHPNRAYRYDTTPLLEAILWGHEEIVRLLVERDDVRPRFRIRDQCPLRQAAESGHLGILRVLLGRWANKLRQRDISRRMLLSAVMHGHSEIVSLLLEFSDVTRCLSGRNGLVLLCIAISPHDDLVYDDRIVQALLAQKEVSPNKACPCHPYSPLLRTAIETGNEIMVQAFLERKDCDVNTVEGQASPLCIAASCGSTEIIRLLLKRPDIKLNITDEYGKPALLHAACQGNESIVSLLLEQPGIDPNGLDVDKWSPCWSPSSIDDPIVQLRSDFPFTRPYYDDTEGWTPLLTAVVIENSAVVETLLRRMDTDPNRPNNDGWTPLLVAAKNGSEEIVKNLLRRSDTRLDLALSDGSTPLMLARQGRHDGVVRLLIEDHRQT
ncbi:ankyrin repeat-containing domain protein [Xylaria arbuscula]|nr:ankyrin repeat-containing domain protein [Xylaria arbuscula]